MLFNRRNFLRICGLSGLFATPLATALLPRRAANAATFADDSAPNVLFISIDDMNDWCGALGGHPDVLTPNIDRLAERGVLFSNAHCTSALCGPSRTSVLTGLRPSTSGVYNNLQPLRAALPTVKTLPQYFKEHGYFATGSGKIFHSPDPLSWSDYYPSLNSPIIWNPNFPPGRPLNGIPERGFIPDAINFDWGPIDNSDDEMGDTQSFAWAEQFLAQEHDAPFFLAVGAMRPHLPWFVPRKYFDLYDEETITLPSINEDDGDDIPLPGKNVTNGRVHRTVVDAGQLRKAVVAYLASISYVDSLVGRLIDALDASPHAQNTVVVLWSDNGYHLGEKLHWQKWTLWEEATRVPLIIVPQKSSVISGPSIEQQGGVSSRPVSLLDIYPTLVDLCGLPPNPIVEGDSLVSLLADPQAEWDRPVVTTGLVANDHAVRSEFWRYIRYNNGAEELYNHEDDPNEWINLAADEQFADVKAAHAAHLPQINAPDAPDAFYRYIPLAVD